MSDQAFDLEIEIERLQKAVQSTARSVKVMTGPSQLTCLYCTSRLEFSGIHLKLAHAACPTTMFPSPLLGCFSVCEEIQDPALKCSNALPGWWSKMKPSKAHLLSAQTPICICCTVVDSWVKRMLQ